MGFETAQKMATGPRAITAFVAAFLERGTLKSTPVKIEEEVYTVVYNSHGFPDSEHEYAPIVLEMYEMAADGYTAAQITNYLNAEGITNHNGCAFHRASVTRLLRNPVYKSDFIAQRHYVDEDRHLVKNNGEKPMLYIEEDHIPIVSRELWDKAQETFDVATHKTTPTESQPLPLADEVPELTRMMLEEIGVRAPGVLEVAFLDGSRMNVRI